MTRRIGFSSLLLALTVVASACDSTGMDRVTAPPTRSADITGSNARNTAIVITRTLQAEGAAFGVIGANGGSVVAGKHSLIVPAGVVSDPTLFAMQVVSGDVVYVKLSAYRMSDGVQIYTFPQPVQLVLSYADAQFTDPSLLTILYLQDGTLTGAAQPMPSTVNLTDMTVSSWLPHFSDYTLGENRSDTTTVSGTY